MEISSIETSDLYDSELTEPSEKHGYQSWDLAHQLAMLALGTCVAGGGYFAFNKKRKITHLTVDVGQPPSPPLEEMRDSPTASLKEAKAPQPPSPALTAPVQEGPKHAPPPTAPASLAHPTAYVEEEKKEQFESPPKLTADELVAATKIFGDLAKAEVQYLLKNRKSYDEPKKVIANVHPFSLLIEMKDHFLKIFKDRNFIIKKEVKDGIKKGLNENQANLLKYTQSLALQMGKDQRIIELHVYRAQWDKLIEYLFLKQS
ncbi:MAG: hypothetical protein COT85_01585 [Chlamydiae bacterium CG10_big_fil_rev_8_21_14_0_10_42_34]|nr:MAG: hypothetical protein COT85_01585 [Chlamydiae bacterium CG10_big_fil_rev_8_21_14_0_10_42_34]